MKQPPSPPGGANVGSRSVLALHTASESAPGLLIIAAACAHPSGSQPRYRGVGCELHHQPVAGILTTCLPTAYVWDSIEGGMCTTVMVMFHRFLRSPGHPARIPARNLTPFLGLYHSLDISTASSQGALRPCAGLEIAQVDFRNCRLSRAFTKNMVSHPFVPGRRSLCVLRRSDAVHDLDKETSR